MNSTAPEAFVLLTLDNCALRDKSSAIHNGTINLECVTIPSFAGDRDVYLVLRIGVFEVALDPMTVIDIDDDHSRNIRVYRFTQQQATEPTHTSNYPDVLSVRRPLGEKGMLGPHSGIHEDLETFESILAQYADVRRGGVSSPVTPANEKSSSAFPSPFADPAPNSSTSHKSLSDPSLRGHLVLINQDNGELVGQVEDKRLHIQEDMLLRKPGHENDPVVIEVPDTFVPGQQEDTAMDVFVRTMSKEDEGLITKGATVVSHAISHTTTLLLTLVTAGANFYISKSQGYTPSSSRAPSPSPGSAAASRSGSAPNPEQPSKVLAFLTSTKTRKNLSKVHAFTGQAVHVSSKTVGMIDKMIKRTVDPGGKNTRASAPSGSAKWTSTQSRLVHKAPNYDGKGSAPPTPSRLQPPGRTSPQPPSPVSHPSGSYFGPASSLPPSYSDATGLSPATKSAPPLPARPLGKVAKVILSADLIFSTLEENAKRLVAGGETTVNNVVRHKYGEDAVPAGSSMTGSAKNVVLVYIDVTGLGRRAILKKVGGELVRAHVLKNRREAEAIAQQQQR